MRAVSAKVHHVEVSTVVSINNLLGFFEKMQSNKIAVEQNRCILVRNKNAACLRCARACPSGCISFDDSTNEITVDQAECIGCGTCATACPTCALEAREPTDSQLLKDALAHMEAAANNSVIACGSNISDCSSPIDPEKVTTVVCLGRVEESLLLALDASDADSIALVHGKCAECPYKKGIACAQDVVSTTNSILEAWGRDLRVELTSGFPEWVLADGGNPIAGALDRRSFFSEMRQEVAHVAREAAAYAMERPESDGDASSDAPSMLAKVDESGHLPQFIPNRRRRILNALDLMGDPEDTMIGTRLWGHVIIDTDHCSSCRMCTVFCPTGALKPFDEDDSFGVMHAPSKCVRCRCCENICPNSAISISDEVFAVDMMKDEVERYIMKPRVSAIGHPSQIKDAIKPLLGCDQVYER